MDTGNRFWGYRGYFQGNKFNAGKFKQKFPSSATLVASTFQSFIELPPFSTPMEHPRKRTNVLSLRLKEQNFERKGNLICLLVPLSYSLVFGGVYIYMHIYIHIRISNDANPQKNPIQNNCLFQFRMSGSAATHGQLCWMISHLGTGNILFFFVHPKRVESRFDESEPKIVSSVQGCVLPI